MALAQSTTHVASPQDFQYVFVTFVVDTTTPVWSYIFKQYLTKVLKVIMQINAQKPKQIRVSYVLYSSATSQPAAIVRDIYFTALSDVVNVMRIVSGSIQGPIARNLPDGGSSALEGMVRAIEHFDLLQALEPQSSTCPKYIFFITASPPDDSQRPLFNNCEKFDDYGWKQCEEWLKQRTIGLMLLINRLPPHPTYISLYMALNPSAPDPIPPTGPTRVYPPLSLWPFLKSHASVGANTGASTAQPSPGVTNSPAPNAASPNTNRKRKAGDDPQTSPRRAKFPPAVNSVSISTPPIGSTPATMNNSPQRPPSVTAHRPSSTAPDGQLRTEVTGMPVASQNPMPMNSTPAMQPNVTPRGALPASNDASQNTAGNQTSTSNPIAATFNNFMRTLPPVLMSQMQTFFTSPPAARMEKIASLKSYLDSLEREIVGLKGQNRHHEAKEKEIHRDQVRQLFAFFLKAHNGGMAAQPSNPTPNNLIPMNQTEPLSSAMSGHSQETNSASMPPSSMQPHFNTQIGPGPSQAPPQQQQQQQQPSTMWRGVLCITGQDARNVVSELIVSLSSIKAASQHEMALSSWPSRVFMTPIKNQVPSEMLVTWLASHKPEGLFRIRPLGLQDWPPQRQATAAAGVQDSMKKFIHAQESIIKGNMLLRGTVELTTGGTNTFIVFHTPPPHSNSSGTLEAQIALARYTSPPDLSTLPGILVFPAISQNPANPQTMAGWTNQAMMSNAQPNLRMADMNAPFTNNSINKDISGNLGGMNSIPGMATTNTGVSSGATSNAANHPFVNMLIQSGKAHLINSLGGAEAIAKNPALLQRIAQQHQMQQQQQQQLRNNQALGANLMNPALGLGGLNTATTTLGNAGLSGATLLDRLNNQPLPYGSMMNTGVSNNFGNNALGPGAANALQRQQLVNSAAAHSAAVGAMNAHGNTSSNSSFFNQLGGLSANMTASRSQVNPSALMGGTMGPAMSVGNSGMNNMMSMGGNVAPSGIPAELLQRAAMIARQNNIPLQDALRILTANLQQQRQNNLQQQGWNAGLSRGNG